MFNQIFRISNINQNRCQWKVGLPAQDFWVIKADLLVVKRCYFPEFYCERAGGGTAHGSCGFLRYPEIISKSQDVHFGFTQQQRGTKVRLWKEPKGSMWFLQSPNISGPCLQMSAGNPSLYLSMWKVFRAAPGAGVIALPGVVKGWTLPVPFFHGSKARSARPKSCWAPPRISLHRKWELLLQCGSGLGRTRAENPSETLTPLTSINNLLCLPLNHGFVQIPVDFPTSESAQLPSHRFRAELCLLTWARSLFHPVSASGQSLQTEGKIFLRTPSSFEVCLDYCGSEACHTPERLRAINPARVWDRSGGHLAPRNTNHAPDLSLLPGGSQGLLVLLWRETEISN